MYRKFKLLILNGLFLCLACTAYAQTDSINMGHRTYQQVFDSISTGLIKSRVPYGVLYDRVYPWSNLLKWRHNDTINSTRFFQSWWDMEQSRFSEATVTPVYNTMRTTVGNNLLDSIINLVNIRENFGYLDSTAITDGRLSYTSHQLIDNNLGSPYLTKSISIFALPDDTFIKGRHYTLRFDTTIALNNTAQTIDHIDYYNLTNGDDRN